MKNKNMRYTDTAEVWEWSTNVFRDWKSATISTTKSEHQRKTIVITTCRTILLHTTDMQSVFLLPVACLYSPFISFKASSKPIVYFRQSIGPLSRVADLHTFPHSRANEITLRHIPLVSNNYRLTDSIIQTTWNVKLPYF